VAEAVRAGRAPRVALPEPGFSQVAVVRSRAEAQAAACALPEPGFSQVAVVRSPAEAQAAGCAKVNDCNLLESRLRSVGSLLR
jgi:hypothetical protein